MPHPIVRFAPSPTGRIHIGNARTALLNFLYAKKHHGEFILRFDDTDVERSKEEFAQAIEVDLAWLGIVPDAVLRQSGRFGLYRAAAKKLREAGRLYPCYETAEELDRKRKRQQARGLPLVAMSTLGYDATMGIALRGDSPIKTPKDLQGKKIGTVPTSAESPYWQAFARKAGIDTSGISMVQMDNRVLEQSLVNKQVDAITAIGTSSIPVIIAMKEPCRFMLWSTAGITLYAGQVVTRQDVFAKDKELCRAVTDALTEGLAYAMKDPEASVDIFLKEIPEIGITASGKENARISQGLMHYTVISKEAETQSLGFTDMAKAGDMVDMVMEFGAPKDAKKPVLSELFTNELVGSVKLSAAEWAQVKKNVAEYAAILG